MEGLIPIPPPPVVQGGDALDQVAATLEQALGRPQGSTAQTPDEFDTAKPLSEDAGGTTAVGNQIATTGLKLKNQIIPQPNVLSQYASYTYNLSLYLLSQDVVKKIQKNALDFRKDNLSGYHLLARSGGAPTEGISEQARIGARNRFFKLDYYIDDLIIHNQYPSAGGHATGAHSATKVQFKLYEPYGITFVDNLRQAVNEVYGRKGSQTSAPAAASSASDGSEHTPASETGPTFTGGVFAGTQVPWSSGAFAFIIRFYGYDDQGTLVQAKNSINQTSANSQAVVEKFIPFVITKLDFRVSTKVVEYDIEGSPLQYTVAGAAPHGTVTEQLELIGSTVKELLVGKPVGTKYPAPVEGRIVKLAPGDGPPRPPETAAEARQAAIAAETKAREANAAARKPEATADQRRAAYEAQRNVDRARALEETAKQNAARRGGVTGQRQ